MRTYVVQPGDSPASIASRDHMAGCPKCSIDLIQANRHKPTVQYANGYITFRDLQVGETLNLPDRWFDGSMDRLPRAYFDSLPHADGGMIRTDGGVLGANGKTAPPHQAPGTGGAIIPFVPTQPAPLPTPPKPPPQAGGGHQTGGAGSTITFQSGHRYRITIYTSIARSALSQAQLTALAGWIDSLGLDSGSITNTVSEHLDANTSAVVFDYTGPLRAVKLPDSPIPDVAQMTVEDLGASPPPAAQGMATGVKVALGVVGAAALLALIYFSTEGR